MAPIEPSTCNSPAVMHAPEAPPDAISWRSMAVNWAGSMLFIGICAPLMVWLTVYCIRTRRKRNKGKAKPGTAPTTAEQSAQQLMRRYDRIETYDLVPLDPGPPARDNNKKKIPKITHLSRYLGWWSSGTSREENYPPDPRARKKGSRPYTKREHFTRFLGWCTSSEHEGNDEPRRHSDPGPRARAREKQRAEAPSTSRGSHEEMESSGLQQLAVISRRGQLGRHKKAHMSLENLVERGQLRSSQLMPSIEDAKAIDQSPQVPHVSTTGADVKRRDASSQSGVQSRGEGELMMDGLLGTDETSARKTVRRRTAGIAEACDWASLSNELRRSVHTQVLLPDKRDDGASTVESFEHTDAPPAHTLPSAKRVASSAKSLEKGGFLVLSPKLRKVHSSPTLHIAYKQLDTSLGSQPSSTVQNLTLSSSSPARLNSFHDQVDGLDVEINDNHLPNFTFTSSIHWAESSTLMKTENVSQSSLTFSFDKTRRSTLDVIRIPSEVDCRTLNEYEAAYSVDAEISTRASSETTMSSFEKQLLRTDDENEASLRPQNLESNDKTYGAVDCTSIMDSDSSLRHFENNLYQTSPKNVHVPISDNAKNLYPPSCVTDLLVTSTMPKRRYSFPSLEKGINIRVKIDRKFTYRFSNSKEKEIAMNCKKWQTLPRNICKIPVTGFTGKRGLVVSKKRASRSCKGNDKKKSRPRKLTPFVGWSYSSSSKSSPRKSLPSDWQVMDRLSEATSFHSENEPTMHRRCGTTSLYWLSTSLRFGNEPIDANHSPDRSTIQDFVTCSTSPSNASMPATPRPHFDTPLRVMPSQDIL